MRSVLFGVRVRFWSLAVTSCLASGCVRDGVVAFRVDPPLVCGSKAVSISWKVQGRAQIKADPPPPNWNEKVPSEGEMCTVPVATDTLFTIVALDASPARGASYASQPAYVTAQTENRAAQATCDPSGTCKGDITLRADSSVRVSKIGNPTWRSGFKVAGHEVCVTTPGGSRTCLAPKTSVPLNLPANGKWTFDLKLAPDENGAPPPELRVYFDFGCQ